MTVVAATAEIVVVTAAVVDTEAHPRTTVAAQVALLTVAMVDHPRQAHTVVVDTTTNVCLAPLFPKLLCLVSHWSTALLSNRHCGGGDTHIHTPEHHHSGTTEWSHFYLGLWYKKDCLALFCLVFVGLCSEWWCEGGERG